MANVSLQKVSKSYHNFHVVHGIDLDIVDANSLC